MDFNWEAIGAAAEALGVIGVIVTVVYVGVQIRHNSQAVQGATEQALMTQEMALYALLAEHANIYRRGSENADQLDADEYTADWPHNIHQLGFRHAWDNLKQGYPAEFRQCLDEITPELGE